MTDHENGISDFVIQTHPVKEVREGVGRGFILFRHECIFHYPIIQNFEYHSIRITIIYTREPELTYVVIFTAVFRNKVYTQIYMNKIRKTANTVISLIIILFRHV